LEIGDILRFASLPRPEGLRRRVPRSSHRPCAGSGDPGQRTDPRCSERSKRAKARAALMPSRCFGGV